MVKKYFNHLPNVFYDDKLFLKNSFSDVYFNLSMQLIKYRLNKNVGQRKKKNIKIDQ